MSVGGSGANAPAYISAPFDALQDRAYADDTSLFWDFNSEDPTIDANTDACLVFINAFATEGFDRLGLHGSSSIPNFLTQLMYMQTTFPITWFQTLPLIAPIQLW